MIAFSIGTSRGLSGKSFRKRSCSQAAHNPPGTVVASAAADFNLHGDAEGEMQYLK